MDTGNAQAAYSLFRSLPLSAERSKYASALVRTVGGMLIAPAPHPMD